MGQSDLARIRATKTTAKDTSISNQYLCVQTRTYVQDARQLNIRTPCQTSRGPKSEVRSPRLRAPVKIVRQNTHQPLHMHRQMALVCEAHLQRNLADGQ